MSIPQVLDAEFKRVAREDDVSMETLVDDVSRASGFSPRQLYNFRSGKWPLPASLIPIACRRFKSRALLYSLIAEVERTPVIVPETYELTRLTTQAVRDAMSHYTLILDLFDDRRMEKPDVDELRRSTESVSQTLWAFLEIAQSAYRRHRRPTEEVIDEG